MPKLLLIVLVVAGCTDNYTHNVSLMWKLLVVERDFYGRCSDIPDLGQGKRVIWHFDVEPAADSFDEVYPCTLDQVDQHRIEHHDYVDIWAELIAEDGSVIAECQPSWGLRPEFSDDHIFGCEFRLQSVR